MPFYCGMYTYRFVLIEWLLRDVRSLFLRDSWDLVLQSTFLNITSWSDCCNATLPCSIPELYFVCNHLIYVYRRLDCYMLDSEHVSFICNFSLKMNTTKNPNMTQFYFASIRHLKHWHKYIFYWSKKQDNRNFQIFPSTCCPCLQTKHAHLIGQWGSCVDKMWPSWVMWQNDKNLPHFQYLKLTTVSFRQMLTER